MKPRTTAVALCTAAMIATGGISTAQAEPLSTQGSNATIENLDTQFSLFDTIRNWLSKLNIFGTSAIETSDLKVGDTFPNSTPELANNPSTSAISGADEDGTISAVTWYQDGTRLTFTSRMNDNVYVLTDIAHE